MKKETKAMQHPPPSLEPRIARSSYGPQPAFSRDQIVAIAVKIADTEGIEAVSMRKSQPKCAVAGFDATVRVASMRHARPEQRGGGAIAQGLT